MSRERRDRQRAIVSILGEPGPHSAGSVAKRLAEMGIEASQATIANDLEQIGAVRVRKAGKLGYVLPEKLGGRSQATERLRRIFADWVHAVETSVSMIVVRTPPGSAHLVALAIDQAKFPEVVGTIAGDDALFVAVRGDLSAEPLAARLRDLIVEH